MLDWDTSLWHSLWFWSYMMGGMLVWVRFGSGECASELRTCLFASGLTPLLLSTNAHLPSYFSPSSTYPAFPLPICTQSKPSFPSLDFTLIPSLLSLSYFLQMDKTHFDQDYTAPRYTQLQIGGASLPLRQPSSRLRNPSHPNSIPGLTLEESIEEHLSPREFLPALPLEPRSPCPVAGHPLPSSLRSSSVAELYHIQSAQLSQNQQVPAPYTLRPVTVAQREPFFGFILTNPSLTVPIFPLSLTAQESASNIAHGTRRMVYRTGDIRGAQAIGLTHSRHLSSSSSSGRSNTSTPTRPSPSGSRRELSPHVGAQSLAVSTLCCTCPTY